MHHLSLSDGVSLGQCPRLGLLEVEIAFGTVLHSNSQAVLKFNLLHQLDIFRVMAGQVGDKFGITTVSASFVAWQDAFVGRGEEFKSAIAEVAQVG